MLKHLPICAALIALTTVCANAQQQQAVLHKFEVPGTAFELILASPKTGAGTFDLGESPDALVVNLIGGKLAVGFENPREMLQAAGALRAPGCAFHLDDESRTPIAIYLIRKE
jgi:hypothetical protein